MNPNLLIDLLDKAKSSNKAVKLINLNKDDLAIVEPDIDVEVSNNTLISETELIDLDHVTAALMIPNKEERKEEREKLWESIPNSNW